MSLCPRPVYLMTPNSPHMVELVRCDYLDAAQVAEKLMLAETSIRLM